MANPGVKFRAVLPGRRFDDRVITEAIVQHLRQKVEPSLMRSLKNTTATWKTPVDFYAELSRRGDDAVLFVGTDDDRYRWVNNGTRIRWALTSRDWKSKTTPRKLTPGPGAGRIVIAGRRAMTAAGIQPRPGIKAREFTHVIAENRAKTYGSDMQRIIDGAAKNVWK
jgi:hypothetical protein